MAEYTIIVDDRTKLTKSLIELVINLSKLDKNIRVFSEKDNKVLNNNIKKDTI